MVALYLIRHGQAGFGKADYDQLSSLGVIQGQRLAPVFAGFGRRFAGIVTGGMRRHMETAVACLDLMPPELLPAGPFGVDAGLAEYDHEALLRLVRPDLDGPLALQRFLAGAENPKRAFQTLFAAAFERWVAGDDGVPDFESWVAFKGRVAAALQRLIEMAATADGDFLVFTSGGPIAAILQRVLNIPDAAVLPLNWSLNNGAITRLTVARGKVHLGYFNNFVHLEASPELITYR